MNSALASAPVPGTPGSARAFAVAIVVAAALPPLMLFLPSPAKALALVGLAAAGVVLVTGPYLLVPALFLAAMAGGHLSQSPFTVPLGMAEAHPRELLLLLLIAWSGWQMLVRRRLPPWDLMHVFVILYALAFVHFLAMGLFRAEPLQEIVKECRYPLFIAAYLPLLVAMRSPRDSWKLVSVVLAIALGAAVAGLGFFSYCWLTEQTINTQNILGEFVRRRFDERLVQSVRPAPHLWMEVAVPVLAALACCGDFSRRLRLLLLGLFLLLLAGLSVSFMRTGYVTVLASLVLLALLCAPPKVQLFAGAAGVLLAGLALCLLLLRIDPSTLWHLQDWEISLRARMVETLGALELASQYPLLGAGLGSSFEGLGYASKTTQFTYGPAQYQSLHNVWLYYLMKGGLLGLLLTVFAVLGIAGRAVWTAYRLPGGCDRLLLLGLTAGLLAQCIASLAMPRLTYPAGHVLLGLVAATTVQLGHARKPG